MKYIKKYKVFESIHPLNTNIKELDSNFVSDIIDICADLNDQFPQTDPDGDLVKFYSPYFRAKLKEEPFPEYPSMFHKLCAYTLRVMILILMELHHLNKRKHLYLFQLRLMKLIIEKEFSFH